MSDPINTDMIRIARESRGLTQSCLAKRLCVSQGKISKIESGMLGVSDEMIKKVAEELSYPVEFFSFKDSIYGCGVSGMGIIYHRSRKNLSDKIVDKIHAQINIRRIHIERLLRSIKFEKNLFHTYDIDEYDGDVDKIAQHVRADWLLPRGPIRNIVKSIENAGGIVINFDFETKSIDAISQWIPGLPPLFFINVKSPGDRLRFSLAHEIGHTVMHRQSSLEIEHEADSFAGEFLMPKIDIFHHLDEITLPRLADLKSYWKTSMQSIIRRAFELGRISKRKYQTLMMQMSSAGYRLREPIDIPREEPSLLNEIINVHLAKLNYSASDLSKILGMNEDEVGSLYFDKKPANHLRIIK